MVIDMLVKSRDKERKTARRSRERIMERRGAIPGFLEETNIDPT